MTVAVRPAATVVLLRDRQGGGPPEIFFVKRHGKSAFMANAYVFPGGRVDEADVNLAHTKYLHLDAVDDLARRMHGIEDGRVAAAHVVAAIREMYEEAGVLLHLSEARSWNEGQLEEHRATLLAETMTFFEFLSSTAVVLDGSALRYFAHWITPVAEKRRYDTRFFMAVAPCDQVASHDDKETTDSIWLTASEALDAYQQGDISLAPPTWRILGEMSQLSTLEAILEWGQMLDKVPPIMPHFCKEHDELVLALPGDRSHPQGEEGSENRIILRNGRWWTADLPT